MNILLKVNYHKCPIERPIKTCQEDTKRARGAIGRGRLMRLAAIFKSSSPTRFKDSQAHERTGMKECRDWLEVTHASQPMQGLGMTADWLPSSLYWYQDILHTWTLLYTLSPTEVFTYDVITNGCKWLPDPYMQWVLPSAHTSPLKATAILFYWIGRKNCSVEFIELLNDIYFFWPMISL